MNDWWNILLCRYAMHMFVPMTANQTDVSLQQKILKLYKLICCVYVYYQENNITVSCIRDDSKVREQDGCLHHKFVNIIISKACAYTASPQEIYYDKTCKHNNYPILFLNEALLRYSQRVEMRYKMNQVLSLVCYSIVELLKVFEVSA